MLEKEKKPFNDVIDHMDKIEGSRLEKIEMKTLPKPIRVLGYFLLTFVVVSTLLTVILSLINN
ncbi:amino acid transporter [Sporolactobacillus shoreicorticis]|uniref:Amino acid transporter n=1 Tax=Sporolactobacillus shoreicorticis TaxID=1923877 RepID=A0ABW5S0H5_9BACL|nr:amino acid transporter [Sporolactobacillus shoreicorticis]MCO7128027.1 amino acid transporter [Sporolactobacillus shoreicorticis]